MTTRMTSMDGSTRHQEFDDYELEALQLGDLVWRSVYAALVTAGAIGLGTIVFMVLSPLIHGAPELLGSATKIDQTFTAAVASGLTLIAPFVAYAICGTKNKDYIQQYGGHIEWGLPPRFHHLLKRQVRRGILAVILSAFIVYTIISMAQFVFQVGPFSEKPSLQMTLRQTDEGILVEEIIEDGAADEAGIEVGALITGIRRAEVTLEELNEQLAQADFEDIFRLRIVQDGEEEQIPVEVVPAIEVALLPLIVGLIIAVIVAFLSLVWPARITPYALLILIMVPLMIGYLWLVVASFSYRTEGILPIDQDGNFGGFSLDNWDFLMRQDAANQSIWQITFTTFIIAAAMTFLVLLVSSMAGYALSRMSFKGRKTFLSLTLILHGFPAVTLLIAIFFVLRNIGSIPFIGDYFGFNTRGGIALVMVAFELPLGVWLMKGFFDNIPWDLERSALIDGASRWRTFWQILLPQIRPGLLALGIFAFISGWGAYLIPQTYSVGTRTATLAVYINQLTSDTAPVNWNQVAAVGLYQMVPVFIIFVFAQEYLLNIYAGGSKGTS